VYDVIKRAVDYPHIIYALLSGLVPEKSDEKGEVKHEKIDKGGNVCLSHSWPGNGLQQEGCVADGKHPNGCRDAGGEQV
jgi:hypothetical protein